MLFCPSSIALFFSVVDSSEDWESTTTLFDLQSEEERQLILIIDDYITRNRHNVRVSSHFVVLEFNIATNIQFIL